LRWWRREREEGMRHERGGEVEGAAGARRRSVQETKINGMPPVPLLLNEPL